MSYITMVFEILSTLLLTPFIIRTLGQAEYGVYKLSTAIIAYLMLLDLGVGNAVIRYTAKYRASGEVQEARKFLGVASLFYSAIAVITILLGCILIKAFPVVFAKGLNSAEIELGQKLLFITTLNCAVTLGTAQFANTITGYERFSFVKGVQIVQIIIRVIFTVVALALNMKSIAIVSITLMMTVLTRGLYVIYVLFKLKLIPSFKKINFMFVKDVIIYSSFILLQMVATQINSMADQVLLGMLVPSSAVVIAIYGVGTQIVQYYQSMGTAMTGVLMPGIVRIVEQGADSKDIEREMIRIGRIILLFLSIILLGFMVCGREFIVLWAGEANSQGYYVALILMVAYTLILTESVGTQVLWAMNEHKEQSVLKIAVVILNVLLTIALINWNALIGATIGTFISLMLGDVGVMNYVFHKKIGVSLGRYYQGLFRKLLPCFMATLLAGLAMNSFVPITGWGRIIGVALSMIIVYGMAMWLYGMNEYERNLVASIMKRLHLSR